MTDEEAEGGEKVVAEEEVAQAARKMSVVTGEVKKEVMGLKSSKEKNVKSQNKENSMVKSQQDFAHVVEQVRSRKKNRSLQGMTLK